MRTFGIAAGLFWIAATVRAQSIERLLPAGAVVIETQDVSVGSKSRALVLWMVGPSRHVREPDSGYGHGFEGEIDDDVTFDRAKQRFVDKQRIKMMKQ
jgi:hypothetical protein